MSNLLRPFDIPSTAYDLPWSEWNRSAPDTGREPMPSQLGAATGLDGVPDGSSLMNMLKTLSAGGIGGSDGLSWLPVESPYTGSHMGGYWQLSAPCLTQDQKDHRHRWMTSPHLAFLPLTAPWRRDRHIRTLSFTPKKANSSG
jgi:hypothetical protein